MIHLFLRKSIRHINCNVYPKPDREERTEILAPEALVRECQITK